MIGGRAVVVGSGMAGLFAARVLSEHFDEVVIVDRDRVDDPECTRQGVPQGKHVHALLLGGLQVAKELFPGFGDDLLAAGSVPGQLGLDYVFYRPEGRSYALAYYQPDPRPGEIGYLQTRACLERCTRTRVEALGNVVTRYGAAVREPVLVDGRVAGVVTDDGPIEADLVVDAAGRASRADHWLPQLGYEAPAESHVNCDFAYSTALFRPADPSALEAQCIFVLPPLDGSQGGRGSALLSVEDGQVMVSLASRFGDYPPTDLPDFLQFAKSLPNPVIYDVLSTAEAVTEPVRYRYPKSVRRHYERLERFPEGLVPIGDAICHFNPVYGQGMSSAALQAVELGRVLEGRTDLDGVARDFFPRAYEVTRGPWVFAAAADFQNPKTTGDFPMDEMPALEVLLYLMSSAPNDEEAADFMAELMQLQRPLGALLEDPWPARAEASKAPA